MGLRVGQTPEASNVRSCSEFSNNSILHEVALFLGNSVS